MDIVRAGKPLIDLIKLCYRANRPVLLAGRHGVGKSELLQQAARELKIGFLCRDLSVMEPTDLVGLPKEQGGRTVYLPPEFLPENGRGLLVFEELNRCEKYMQAPCLQLLTARTLNDYTLPAGWLPVAAINPTTGDYQTSELDPALLSRFVQVQVIPDRDEWVAWAQRVGVHPRVVEYVESDPSIFEASESNPRAWVYVSDVLKATEKQQISPQILRSAILGIVGDKRGSAFLRIFKQPERPLAADEIIGSYIKHRRQVQRWIAEGRLDMVQMTLRALLTALQPEADFAAVRRSRTKWQKVGQFLSDLPGDLQQSAQEFFAGREYQYPGFNGAKRRKR